MKQTTVLLNNLSKQTIDNLTTVVKETLATGFGTHPRQFGTVDLWNIQRNRRGIPTRRCLI